MYTDTDINIRTTRDLKIDAEDILRRMGMDMSTAVNIFLTQLVSKNAIPFEISAPPKQTAKLGGWEGKIVISENFNDPMEDF
jgi:addiction module RelB/DinJ family antitoxin